MKKNIAALLVFIVLFAAVLAVYLLKVFPKQADSIGSLGPDTHIRVITLGTGNPVPSLRRFGPSTLVQAGGHTLLFDAGRGVMQRLYQLGVPVENVNKVFITHLHSDHIIALDDVYLTTWNFGRTGLFHIWGPPGTQKFVKNIEEGYSFDIGIRMEDSGLPYPEIKTTLFETDGVIFEKDGVKVTAFEVNHAPIKPAYGYRVDYNGYSVAISGDTRYSENLIKSTKNVDVLIHEVAHARPGTLPEKFEAAFAHHTNPQEAGKVFEQTKPRLAVYSHIVLYPGTFKKHLEDETKKTFDGNLLTADDLTIIDIGKKINIRRLKNPIGKAQMFYARAKEFFHD